MLSFRKTILHARIDNFISQIELARVTGLSRQFISKLESGRQSPSFENFCVIAKGLGVDPPELLRRFFETYYVEFALLKQRRAELDMFKNETRSMSCLKTNNEES